MGTTFWKKWSSGFVVVLCLTLPACSPVGFFSSSVSSLDSSSQERGLGGYVGDGEIRMRYHFILFDYDHKLFYYVKTNVNEGKILLLGHVPNEKMVEDAVRLAWRVPGVKGVINELVVGESSGFTQTAHDKWISAKLNTLLIFDKKVRSRNFEVLVVDGTVFLVGIAESKEELEAAIQVAKGVSGVKHVVSYVRIVKSSRNTYSKKGHSSTQSSDMEKRRALRQQTRQGSPVRVLK